MSDISRQYSTELVQGLGVFKPRTLASCQPQEIISYGHIPRGNPRSAQRWPSVTLQAEKLGRAQPLQHLSE